MWLLLAFCSAALLGFYDVFKKKSLANNAVLPVLGLNTLFSSLIFLPFILVSYFHPAALQDTLFVVFIHPVETIEQGDEFGLLISRQTGSIEFEIPFLGFTHATDQFKYGLLFGRYHCHG